MQETGSGGEIQLTDAMITLSQTQPFYGLKFAGRSFDCGSKVGFLAANVAYALARDDLGPAMRDTLREFLELAPPQADKIGTSSRTNPERTDEASDPPQLATTE
jgi:hypothetical protein